MKCEDCKWFDIDSARAEAVTIGEGLCRRFPPPAAIVFEKGPASWDFPEVMGDDFCGEFEDARLLVPVDARGVVRAPEGGLCPTCREPIDRHRDRPS